MRHSGIPTKTHQKGCTSRPTETAVHRAFQIKTFSTELKNHVMVMDFVKSNWFPSQRRAKVCIIHMYQGLKTAEQTASRYEVWLNLGGKQWAHYLIWRTGGVPHQRGRLGVLSGLINESSVCRVPPTHLERMFSPFGSWNMGGGKLMGWMSFTHDTHLHLQTFNSDYRVNLYPHLETAVCFCELNVPSSVSL